MFIVKLDNFSCLFTLLVDVSAESLVFWFIFQLFSYNLDTNVSCLFRGFFRFIFQLFVYFIVHNSAVCLLYWFMIQLFVYILGPTVRCLFTLLVHNSAVCLQLLS